MRKETDKTLRIRAVKINIQFLIDDLESLRTKIDQAFTEWTENRTLKNLTKYQSKVNTALRIGGELEVLEKELKLLRG